MTKVFKLGSWMQLLKGIEPTLALRICLFCARENTFIFESWPTDTTRPPSFVTKTQLTVSLWVVNVASGFKSEKFFQTPGTSTETLIYRYTEIA